VGTLTYDGLQVEFEDRLLTHLQVVIITKFRVNESFTMSWVRSVAQGSGRTSMWMVPSTPVIFRFRGSRVPAMNRVWLHQLTESASSARGLIVVNEDGSLAIEAALPRDVRQRVS
jgi:hypothetical protein